MNVKYCVLFQPMPVEVTEVNIETFVIMNSKTKRSLFINRQ